MLEVKILGRFVTAYKSRPNFRGDPSFGKIVLDTHFAEWEKNLQCGNNYLCAA